jgi:hypothetical protein
MMLHWWNVNQNAKISAATVKMLKMTTPGAMNRYADHSRLIRHSVRRRPSAGGGRWFSGRTGGGDVAVGMGGCLLAKG